MKKATGNNGEDKKTDLQKTEAEEAVPRAAAAQPPSTRSMSTMSTSSGSQVGAHSVNIPVARLGETKAKRDANQREMERRVSSNSDHSAQAKRDANQREMERRVSSNSDHSALVSASSVGAHSVVGGSRLGDRKTKREANRNSLSSNNEHNGAAETASVAQSSASTINIGVGAHSVVGGSRLGDSKTKRESNRNSVLSNAPSEAASGAESSTTIGAHSVVGRSRLGESKTKREANRDARSIAAERGSNENITIPAVVGAHHSHRSLGEAKGKREARASANSATPTPIEYDDVIDVDELQERLARKGAILPYLEEANPSAQERLTARKGAILPYLEEAHPSAQEARKGTILPYLEEAEADTSTNPNPPVVPHVEPGATAHGTGTRSIGSLESLEEQAPPQGYTDADLAVAQPVDEMSTSQDLPQADDVDLEAQEERRKEHQKKNWRLLFFGLVVLGVIALIVGLTVNKGGEEKIATEAPSSSPSMAPTSFLDGIKDLLPMSTRMAIDASVTSPQARAFDWLVEDDIRQGYPDWRIIQRFALATFYYATNGDSWYNNTGWMDHASHECEWPNFNTSIGLLEEWDDTTGETTGYKFLAPVKPCNATGEIFHHLWLADNGLDGTLPEEIGLLTGLQQLAAHANNDIHGTIPTEIGRLTNLEGFAMAFVSMKGSQLPSEIGLLGRLRFSVSTAAQLGGPIPSEIGLLSNLEYFSIAENIDTLTGTIPSEIGQLGKLSSIDAFEAGVGGQLPSQMGLLTSLHDVELLGSALNGTIPTELGGLSALVYLGLARNQITGPIPSELGSLPRMEWIVIRNNALTGQVPSQLGLLSGMYAFGLRNNILTGSIPTQLGMMGDFGMESLMLANNQLTGPIPSELGLIPSLMNLVIRNNDLSGPVPSELGLLGGGLNRFDISTNNALTGTVPSEVCYLGETGCTFFDWYQWGDVECVFNFDCSETLCGCDCPCGSNSTNATTGIRF